MKQMRLKIKTLKDLEKESGIALRVTLPTGLWRVFKPEIDHNRCIKCGICEIYCPDYAIYKGGEHFVEVDYNYCKGCGVCANECPAKCINMVRETFV